MPLPATAPDWVETIELYSAFGPETKTIKPAEPEATSSPEVKSLPPPPAKVEGRRTATTTRPALGKNQKKPSTNASGHIL
jgi:hypothetical protein